MARSKQKWIEIEYVKGVLPNILYMFKKLKEINEPKRELIKQGKKVRLIFACVYCGRIYKNTYRMIGHLQHCSKKKDFVRIMHEGLDFEIGNKIFHISSNKVKIFRDAEKYEVAFRDKVLNKEMKAEEAERMFFMFLAGTKSASAKDKIEFEVKEKETKKDK
jgi:hypothetical protein